MAATETTLVAYATIVGGYGDLDVTVEGRDAKGCRTFAISSGPQAKGYNPDTALADLGYERVGEWAPTAFGEVCNVKQR